jgi:hypothetical protein
MLDHLDVAQRRYETMRTATTPPADFKKGQNIPFWPDLGKETQISLWLQNDVCPIVEELVENPVFREHASWPIRHLQAGSRTAERALVDEIGAGLVECARQLAKIARQPKVLTELRKLELALVPTAFTGSGSPMPLGLQAMEFIMRRPWRDLVSIFDYWQPGSNLNLIHPEKSFGASGKPVTLAEFIPFFNPGLRTLGDFVTRMLFLRIEYWENLLIRFWDCLLTVLRNSKMERDAQWTAFEEMCDHLRRNKAQLKECTLMGKAANFRNSFIALLQVYAEYRPLAPLEWLGIPSELPRNGQAIRHRIEARKEFGVAEQIAAALIDVEPIYREEMDPQLMIMEKVESHSLVLVSGVGRRDVYWQKELLAVDWEAQNGPWQLLSTLADRANSKQGTDETYLRDSMRGSLKDFRSRLKKVLPPDLNKRIRPAGRQTYRLDLDPTQVCVLHFTEVDRLEEFTSANSLVPVRARP